MVQKVIRIGSSAGVTIPKKQLEELGLSVGDSIQIEIKPVSEKKQSHQKQLLENLEHFMATYDQDLKHLARR